MTGLLFDSSLYIAAFRRRRDELLTVDRYGTGPLYLSSVVGYELYVGARTPRLRRLVDRLWQHAKQVERLLAPTANDWRDAGQLLERLAQRSGRSGVAYGHLTDDALIACTARRSGLTVVTLNGADFALLAQARPFQFIVVDPAAPV